MKAGGRWLAALALTLVVAGCGGAPVALRTGPGACADDLRCCFTSFTVGELVADSAAGTAIIEDQDQGGQRVPVQWPPGYTGRSAGSEVEVVDVDGHVVARTGTRMKLLGGYRGVNWIACYGGVYPAQ